MKQLLTILLTAFCFNLQAQNLIPQPIRMTMGKGYSRSGIVKTAIDANFDPKLFTQGQGVREEAYSITITKDTIYCKARTGLGLLRARQTLAQLKTRKGYPICTIEDEPALSWRGAMIDVSRHFFPMDVLKKQIDQLAQYKINVLHLHLTDGGGWRMQINRYPRLTEKAAYRTQSDWKEWWDKGTDRHFLTADNDTAYGGYFTQAELRALVGYASARGITIVPEIEMPGHSNEVMHAYPELQCRTDDFNPEVPPTSDLCLGNVGTLEFMENILDEVMQVFPSRYIHIGGDEAGMEGWRKCPLCQAKMRELGISDVHGLQAWFINQIDQYLQHHGRKMIAWDEVLTDSLKSTATVMVWRDLKAVKQAFQKGCDVVLSPSAYYYLDYYQDAPPTQPTAIGGFQPFDRVNQYAPLAEVKPVEQPHVLGVQGNLWTEYVKTPDHLEYMLYPRILAIAETGWGGSRREDPAVTRRKALAECQRLQKLGYNAFDLNHEVGQRPEARQPLKHLARGAKVTYLHPYSPYYAAQGEPTLTDGQRGGWQHGDGNWQGFVNKEGLDVVVDLGAVKPIHQVELEFMQSDGAWIYLPGTFSIETSVDGKAYTLLYNKEQPMTHADRTIYVPWGWKGKARARYIHVKATPVAQDQWVFTDEIIVR